MIRFLDGPMQGAALNLTRLPVMMRCVVGPNGGRDALDQADDVVNPDETPHCYIRCSKVGHIHISCRPRSKSGWYLAADYRLCSITPTDEDMRDNTRWGEWCESHRAELMAENGRLVAGGAA